MTRQRAAELWPVMKGYAEGKIIQHRDGNQWNELSEPAFDGLPSSYRIKPEPREWWETRAGGHSSVEHETLAKAQEHAHGCNLGRGFSSKFSVFHIKEVV